MATFQEHHKLQLELYVDGELDPSSHDEVERLLEQSQDARNYLDVLSELRIAATLPFDFAAESIRFDQMQARLFAQLQDDHVHPRKALPHDEELELLAMAWADGELHDARDIQRVLSWLAETPSARDFVEGLRDVRNASVLAAGHAADQVDFGAMTARIMSEVDPSFATVHTLHPAPAAETSRERSGIVEFFSSYRAPIAALAGIAAACAVALPFALRTPQTNVTNHYYLGETSIEGLKSDPGHLSTIREGNDIYAPVVWIEAAPSDQTSFDQGPTAPAAPSERSVDPKTGVEATPPTTEVQPKVIDL